VLVGALDTRDLSKPAPTHYVRPSTSTGRNDGKFFAASRAQVLTLSDDKQTEEDLEASKKAHDAIGAYYECVCSYPCSLSGWERKPCLTQPGRARAPSSDN